MAATGAALRSGVVGGAVPGERGIVLAASCEGASCLRRVRPRPTFLPATSQLVRAMDEWTRAAEAAGDGGLAAGTEGAAGQVMALK